MFSVAEREGKSAVQRRALGTVGSVEETNEAVGLPYGPASATMPIGWQPSVMSPPIDRTTLPHKVCILCVWPAGTSASLTTSTSRLGAPG